MVVGQYRRELLTLGAKTLQHPDNDQLWLRTTHAPTLIHMNTVKADYISAALKTLEPYLE
jgi:hypothetical protein